MAKKRKKPMKEIRLTREGRIFMIILGFITVGAVLRNVNLLILMAGLMYAPLIINWRVGVMRLKSLTARRILPHHVHANQPGSVQWICENQSSLPAWNVEIVDSVKQEFAPKPKNRKQPTPTPHTAGPKTRKKSTTIRWIKAAIRFLGFRGDQRLSTAKVDFIQIAAKKSEVAVFRVFFSQRGRYQVGPATLTTTFPFGLIASRIRISGRHSFFVAPALGRLSPVWDRRVRSAVVGAEAIKRKRGMEEDEFYALRPWRPGDSKKQIHWRTSAKQGQPIVKQYDQQDNRDFAMLLDLHSTNIDEDLDNTEVCQKCETILSFAATVLLHLGSAVQGRIAVGICGQENFVCRSRNQREIIDQSMQKLAIARPSIQTNLTDTLLQLSRSVSASTPLYIFSTRISAGDFLQEQTGCRSEANQNGDSLGQPAELNDGTPVTGNSLMNGPLKSIWPSVCWISVDSDEFQRMFSYDVQPIQKLADSLAQKWIVENAAG